MSQLSKKSTITPKLFFTQPVPSETLYAIDPNESGPRLPTLPSVMDENLNESFVDRTEMIPVSLNVEDVGDPVFDK